jgi:hypothetical protein
MLRNILETLKLRSHQRTIVEQPRWTYLEIKFKHLLAMKEFTSNNTQSPPIYQI